MLPEAEASELSVTEKGDNEVGTTKEGRGANGGSLPSRATATSRKAWSPASTSLLQVVLSQGRQGSPRTLPWHSIRRQTTHVPRTPLLKCQRRFLP